MVSYIKLFTDYDETFDEMSDAEAGRLIKALLHYGASGETRTLSGGERLVFGIIRRQIDRDNDIADVHREAGKTGGRPKRDQNQTEPNKTKRNQTEPNKTKRNQTEPNETKSRNEKEKEKEEDKEKDNKLQQERAREEDHSYRHTPIGDLVSANLSCMTGKAWEDLRAFLSEMPEDLVKWAILDSCDHGGNNWAYVRRVLCALQEAGITTVEEAERRSESHRQNRQRAAAKPIPQLDYEQREYAEPEKAHVPQFILDMETESAG